MEYIMLGCALRTRDKPFRGHKLEIRKDELSNCINMVQKDYLVLVIPKSTSTQSKYMKNNSQELKIMATLPESTQKNYQTLTASSVDSLVRRLASQENDGASMIPVVRSFLTSHGFLGKSNHAILSLRTSKGFYLTTKETHSAPSLPRLMNWGTTVNGVCLTAKTSEFRKTENGCTLSDILEEHPDPKYFLSKEQTAKLVAPNGKRINLSRLLCSENTGLNSEKKPENKSDSLPGKTVRSGGKTTKSIDPTATLSQTA